MKKTFHEFFVLSDDEFNSLWRDGLLSFDANALLNLYRFSPASSDALARLIETYSERIRLPHQFALEYARNRPKVIMRQVKSYLEAETALSNFERVHIRSKRQHPHLSDDALKAVAMIVEELADKRKAVEKLISTDRYANFLLTTCAGKIGEVPDSNQLNDLYAKAKERYERSIPPGYEDQDKAAPDSYGDYVAWEQLISISVKEQKGVILVSDDVKEDWWWIESGRTVGPRPELLSEFASRSGQRVWLYSSEGFLRAARRYVGADVPDKLLEEVSDRLEEERKRQQERQDKPKETYVTIFDESKRSPSPTDGPADGLDAAKTRGPQEHAVIEGKATNKTNAQSEDDEA